VTLEAKATDDCLELLDLLMVTELLGKAERESVKEKGPEEFQAVQVPDPNSGRWAIGTPCAPS